MIACEEKLQQEDQSHLLDRLIKSKSQEEEMSTIRDVSK